MVRIQVELSTRCGANCLYCPRFVIPGTRNLGDMEPRMMEFTLKRLEELEEPLNLSISGFGEPLHFPRLIEFIDEVKARCADVFIELNSNGLLLKGDLAKNLIDRIDDLQISLSLPTPELYVKYKKSNTFWQVRNNLLDFYKMKGSRKPVTDIRLLHFGEVMPHTKYALKIFGLALPEGNAIRVARLENWMGLIDVAKFGMEYIEPTTKHPFVPDMFFVCPDLKGDYLTIQKEGFAFACCFAVALSSSHPTCLGNIEDYGIRELLASRKRVRLFQAQSRGECQYECCTCSKIKYNKSSDELFTRYLSPEHLSRYWKRWVAKKGAATRILKIGSMLLNGVAKK